MKILITGASGMLGADLVERFRDHEVLATDRRELDITKWDDVAAFIAQHKPDAVVNAAAYNFVDNVESDEHYPIAFAVNADGPRHLARVAKVSGIPFVHFSTDYVFAGEKPEGYHEDDEPGAISRYGETKLAGERAVQEEGGDYFILRTSKLFGAPGKSEESKESFVALMLRLAQTLPELKIVHEEVGSPTFTKDLADATFALLEDRPETGIFHAVNEGEGVTWHDFAKEIFEIAGVNPNVIPVSSEEFPKPAKRPKFAKLLNTKLPKLRHRQDALREFLSSLRGA